MAEPLFLVGSHYRLQLSPPYRTVFVQQLHGTEFQFAHTDCQIAIDFFQELLNTLLATQAKENQSALEAMKPIKQPQKVKRVVRNDSQSQSETMTPNNGVTMDVVLGIQWMVDHPGQHLLDSNGDWWMYNDESKLFFTASEATDFESKSIADAIQRSLTFTVSDAEEPLKKGIKPSTNDINTPEEPVPDTLRPLHQSIPHLESNNSEEQPAHVVHVVKET